MGGLVAVLASRNAHKARELEVLLPGWSIEPLDAEGWRRYLTVMLDGMRA